MKAAKASGSGSGMARQMRECVFFLEHKAVCTGMRDMRTRQKTENRVT